MGMSSPTSCGGTAAHTMQKDDVVFRFAAGKIKEVTNFCENQQKADLFFREIYSLKPIPDRLA
jgi:hypothetical protein